MPLPGLPGDGLRLLKTGTGMRVGFSNSNYNVINVSNYHSTIFAQGECRE